MVHGTWIYELLKQVMYQATPFTLVQSISGVHLLYDEHLPKQKKEIIRKTCPFTNRTYGDPAVKPSKNAVRETQTRLH